MNTTIEQRFQIPTSRPCVTSSTHGSSSASARRRSASVRYRYTVDDVQYTDDEFLHAKEMQRSLRMEARHDPFLAKVLELADTQRFMVNKGQEFTYCEYPFHLDTRCKWDWYLTAFGFGGDLKTTFASSQQEFDEAVDFFDWDRSRAWYMDIAHSDRDFIYAISKKNCKVFKKFINRNDDVYNRGREKYEELAFQWWLLSMHNS